MWMASLEMTEYEDALTKAKRDSSGIIKAMTTLEKTGLFQLMLSTEIWDTLVFCLVFLLFAFISSDSHLESRLSEERG